MWVRQRHESLQITIYFISSLVKNSHKYLNPHINFFYIKPTYTYTIILYVCRYIHIYTDNVYILQLFTFLVP